MSMLAENRRTAALALPIIAGHVGQMLMSWVDAVMVGQVGVVPLGACGFANTLLSVPLVFGFGLLSGVSVHASHSHGAGKSERAAESVRGGFAVALLLSLSVLGATYALLPHLSFFGQPAEVNTAAGGYLIICTWSLIPVFFTTVTKNFCEALGRPWFPFWIILAGVGLNAFLNWIFIFGNWHAPAMGIEGAGLATLLARTAVMFAVIAHPLSSLRLRASWPSRWLAPGIISSARRILSVGLPAGGMHLFEVSGFAFGAIMMGWLGVTALAAHQIAMTCVSTTFMVPLGLSQAVCVRVGHARGSGRADLLRPIVFGALVLAAAFMSASLAGFILGGKTIAGWFIGDPDVRVLAAQFLLLGGVFQIFDGIQVVSAGALRGFHDTKIPMGIGVLSYWVVALPVSWAAAFVFGAGAPGIWLGFVVGLAVSAAALFSRARWRVAKACPRPEPPGLS
ncbi:MAG: MATE family efflux transporter [Verrucomicrobiae bacterium]